MNSITEIHENIYDLLESFRIHGNEFQDSLLNTFRRVNNSQRLEKGYWYHGNDNYVAISFWSGNDWKNKTPNIYFRVELDGVTSLVITAKDSPVKASLIRDLFVDQLSLSPLGTDRWIKIYKQSDYIESLNSFLVNDKLIVDHVIRTHFKLFSSGEDVTNTIGFIEKNDFNNWQNNILKYRDNKFYKNLTFSLNSFSVKNFGFIKETDFGTISPNSPFIFLVGENGGGKSTILKAISIALGNKFFTEEYNQMNSPWLINFSINHNGRKKSSKLNYQSFKANNAKIIPFVGYGATRLKINNVISKDDKLEKYKWDSLYSLFFNDGILIDFNRWLLNSLGRRNYDEQEQAKVRLKYENIKQVLISVIPDIYDIRESTFDGSLINQLLYFEEDYTGEKITQGITFENLSSGIKSLVALIGDMMVRLFDQQHEITDPSELAGIVLIDEIDIHLHPKLQKIIPQILAENFPKVQFIVSTHSPIPLLGAPKNSKIFNIYKDYKSGINIKSLNYLNISNLLPNTILTSPIFGMDELVSINNSDETKINVDDSLDDTAFFELLDKKMDELTKKEKILNNKYFS